MVAGYGKEGCAPPHQDPTETENTIDNGDFVCTVLQKTHTITNNKREICIYYCQFVILSYTPKYSIVIKIITRHKKSFYCALSEQTVPHRFKVH